MTILNRFQTDRKRIRISLNLINETYEANFRSRELEDFEEPPAKNRRRQFALEQGLEKKNY